MPIQNGIGYGPETPRKQADFQGLFTQHAYICSGILGRQESHHYSYIDTNAGSGTIPTMPSLKGSPIHALETCTEIFTDHLAARTQFYFIEQDAVNCDSLGARLNNHPGWGRWIHLFEADNAQILPTILDRLQATYGLLYHDPTNLPDWLLLETASKHRALQRIDILVYLSAANMKRCGQRLNQRLSGIQKRHWLIREPAGNHQFSFSLGTNWLEYPAWKQHGFYPIGSPRGKHILEQLSLSTQELHEKHNTRLPI